MAFSYAHFLWNILLPNGLIYRLSRSAMFYMRKAEPVVTFIVIQDDK